MRKSYKPGPKSRNEKGKAKTVNADLGESDDDSNAYSSSSGGDADDFQSPERDDEATDYNFEYTSTGLPLTGDSEGACAGGKANVTPLVAPPRKSAARKSLARKFPQQAKTTPEASRYDSDQETPSATSKPRERPTTAKNPHHRKQLRPNNRMTQQLRYIKEVQQLQQRTDFLIPRLPFSRLVRELIYSARSSGFERVDRISVDALVALQAACEMYMTQRLQDAYMLTLHRGRVTLTQKDMELIKYLRSSASGLQDP